MRNLGGQRFSKTRLTSAGLLTGLLQRLDEVVGGPDIQEVVQVLCLKAGLALLHRPIHNSAILPNDPWKLNLNGISARVG